LPFYLDLFKEKNFKKNYTMKNNKALLGFLGGIAAGALLEYYMHR
jgi:hypothetical protein